jgi:hypothetical protein
MQTLKIEAQPRTMVVQLSLQQLDNGGVLLMRLGELPQLGPQLAGIDRSANPGRIVEGMPRQTLEQKSSQSRDPHAGHDRFGHGRTARKPILEVLIYREIVDFPNPRYGIRELNTPSGSRESSIP